MSKNKSKNDRPKRAIGYCRTSTSRQENGIDAQKDAIIRHCENEGIEIIEIVEERLSGKNDNRPILMAAIEKAKQENAILIISKLDRLSRKVSFLFQLQESGIDFLALDLPEFNSLTLAVFAGMAQHERELISKRTKEGLAQARKKGRIGGRKKGESLPRFAIEKSIKTRRKKAMDENERAKNVVEDCIEMNMTLQQMADKLNRYGIKTPRECKHSTGSVSRIIKLYGLERNKKKTKEGK